MEKLLNYLPLHFVVMLIIGIVTQFYTKVWQFGFLNLLILLLLLSSFLLISNRRLNTILTFLLFFFIGISSVYFNNTCNYKNYYKYSLKSEPLVILKITKILKPGNYNNKYVAEVNQIDNSKTIGKILLNIKKDSLNKVLTIDEKILLKPTFKEIIPPLNPYQFNYQEYLVKQGIEHQVFVEHHQVKALGATNSSLKGIASRFRNYIITSLKKFSFNKDELGVINALLLGQRQDISKELITEYSRAGAIHILAVSGLHVGVIMFVLSFLLKPIERFKKGRFLKACLIVLFLWIFAFIAGLSASVVRAVTMFTFLTIGNIFSAKTNVKFSIITSMLFLLLIKPMFLFDVGFQLSYLAVFGIIWIQPKLYAIWSPKLKFIDKLWQLITVSIAAQAGILPLSIYYFNQFPSLFILSNLVIIPFLGLILFGGILVILLSVLDILPQFVAKMYGNIIHLMNQFVGWISQQESFLIKDISMSFLIMILFYVLLVCGVLFLIRKTTRRLIYFLMSIVVLQGIYMYEKIQKSNKKEFVVFHKSRKSLLGNRVGDTLQLLHNLDSIEFSKSTTTIPYVINENIEQVIESESQNIFQVFNHKILVIDSLGVYQIEGVNHPIIILQSSPKINLTRLIHQLKPKQIIADGSNYKSYINRWEVICEKEKIPFHYTGQKGAFVLKK